MRGVGVRIPDVTGLGLRDAAKAYITAGFSVFPLAERSKNPAPGFVWNEQAWSSPAQVDAWPGEVHGLGLPLALNGLVALDVDHPERLTVELHRLLLEAGAFQSTDAAEPRRGHYVFEAGQEYSNSLSRMPGLGWGEVRGTGYIVVAPTVHPREGGLYEWRSREIRRLPRWAEEWFTPAGQSVRS